MTSRRRIDHEDTLSDVRKFIPQIKLSKKMFVTSRVLLFSLQENVQLVEWIDGKSEIPHEY